MEQKDTFYMNYAEGQSSPTQKYTRFSEAKAEAERLTRMLGVEVFTLMCIHSVKKSDIIVTIYGTPTDLPF